jgi:hypothetical protein
MAVPSTSCSKAPDCSYSAVFGQGEWNAEKHGLATRSCRQRE